MRAPSKRAARKARHADIVLANHALVMVTAALGRVCADRYGVKFVPGEAGDVAELVTTGDPGAPANATVAAVADGAWSFDWRERE